MSQDLTHNLYHLMRVFRHDLLNDLQLLMGHLQLGRSGDTIMEDARTMAARIKEISAFYMCGDDMLATHMWHWQTGAAEACIAFSSQVLPAKYGFSASDLRLIDQFIESLITEISALDESSRKLHLVAGEHDVRLSFKFAPLAPGSIAIAQGKQLNWRLQKNDDSWTLSRM